MFTVAGLTANANQSMTLVLPDGTSIALAVSFKQLQYGWFITSLVYGSFSLTNLRICNSPNMLHQYINQIPFGLAVQSAADREPSLIQDLSSGATTIYVLTAAECQQYLGFLRGD
jgi:hypothetical protein